jgi:hypothetical protein
MNTALLLAVLLAPPGPDCAGPPVLATPEAWAVLKQFALAEEVVGPDERWYSWESEVVYVRRHYHELRGAPPLADARRLPPAERIREGLAFCRACRCRLEQQARAAPSWRWAWYEETLGEVRWAEHVYETMLYATSSSCWAGQRRALQHLRALLGEEAYADAAWPPPVPLHRFRPID